MWSELLKLANSVFELNKTTKKNSADVEKLNGQVAKLTEAVRYLLREQKEAERRHQSEMEKLVLRLENTLLRHGIRVDASEISPPQLPPPDEQK